MPQAITRRVEITAVHAGTNESWNFWVEVATTSTATDAAVANLARSQAIAALEREGIPVSALEVVYIEPLDR